MRTKNIIFAIFVFLIVLSISNNIQAFSFDNIKQYNSDTKTVTIKNSFLGIPTSDIAQVKLNTPIINYVIPGSDRLVAELTINLSNQNYKDALSNIDFYNIENNGIKIGRDFKYKQKVITGKKEVIDWISDCKEISDTKMSCSKKAIGSHFEDTYKWIELKNKDLSKGEITIGIFADVKRGDYIEWVPILFGVEVNEWASWIDSLNVGLVMYHTFDNSFANSSQSTDSLGFHNATNYGAENGSVGKIGQAYSFNTTTYLSIPTDANLHHSTFSVNFWTNLSAGYSIGNGFIGTSNQTTREWNVWLGAGTSGPGNRWEYQHNKLSSPQYEYATSDAGVTASPGLWYMITVINNASGGYIFVNGVLAASDTNTEGLNTTGNEVDIGRARAWNYQYMNGTIDELSYWNRSITESEITTLYNGGDGISYYSVDQLAVLLLSPVDGATISFSNSSFNVSVTPSLNTNITNVTVYLWRSNTTLFNQTTKLLTGNTTNSTILNLYNITAGDYVWNVIACGTNGTHVCSSADKNYSIHFRSYTINSQTFNASTYETSIENFIINITTITNTTVLTGYLNYNGTKTLGTTTCSGLSCIISRPKVIPSLSGNTQQNKTFLWEITDGFDYTNSSVNNQTLNPIILQMCNDTINMPYLNFTFKDEISLADISAVAFGSTALSYGLNPSLLESRTYSGLNTTGNPSYAICFYPPHLISYINGILSFYATNYPQRRYTLNSSSYSNTTTNIIVYLLSSTDGISSSFQITTSAGNPISGVAVNVEKNIGGTYVQVESAVSDSSGLVTFFLNSIYEHRITASKSGYATSIQYIRPTQSLYTIILGSSSNATYVSQLEGIHYQRGPPTGLINTGLQTFWYNISSTKSNLVNCKFELVNGSGYILGSSSSACTSYVYLTIDYNVPSGADIFGRYYADIGSGYFIIEQDANWKNLNQTSSSSALKSLLQLLTDESSWTNGTEEEKGEFEYTKIVAFFIIIAIIFAALNVGFGGADLINPGIFLIGLTLIITMLTIYSGVNGQGFFFISEGTGAVFFDNFMVCFYSWLLTIGYYFSVMERDT